MKIALAAALLVGCGGGLSAVDRAALTDAANVELQVETLVGDGGTCAAPQVRALERAAFCTTAATLHRHKEPVPASSIRCAP